MSDNDKEKKAVNQNVYGRLLIPFSSGLFFVAYAFFWPDRFGRWLGQIVHAFRLSAGF